MSRRPRHFRLVQVAAVPTAFVLSVVTTLAWAWTGGVDQIGLPLGPVGDPTVSLPVLAAPDEPIRSGPLPRPAWVTPSSAGPSPSSAAAPGSTLSPTALSPAVAAPPPVPPGAVAPAPRRGPCRTGRKLVPTCGILWGVAPGAHTESRGASALAEFERKTGRTQAIYHAYHGGIRQLFPTPQEIAIARQHGRKRILFLNWKPESASWAAIARGDKRTDAFLDRLAAHINKNFPERFFLAVHHEAENDVRAKAGSGYTARDYAAMFRHVVKRLRAHGVHNMVTVLVHMAYVPHATQSWFNDMYPGDDYVDWIGFDTYAYSDPGYGHGDFAEVFNRKIEISGKRSWPGFYTWAVTRHPGKPLMIAEWGVWSSKRNTAYKVDFYRELGREIRRFPKIRAMVQFETPHNQKGQDSSVDSTPAALHAYRKLGKLPIFQVAVTP
ncbi:glycoside hydrolase family 26 protein [Paractinoplanes rhizophilus]|uniref:Glycoside hydrolase family 26 protein n=1 Tax=Paractinoplanes rhizophilus TaxID=1416877 RepID=A0ABW2HMD1_9ACTN|nr:glycosyl hydrolase [Actinoplanes sp.]